MIRNYLGFPRGITGADLAQRAYEQAWLLGAEFVYARRARGLRATGRDRIVLLDDGAELRCRAVVVATGVTYRRLTVPGLDPLLGAGVSYGAAAPEAEAMSGQDVFVVGGANSAGQAALHLARYARTVTLVVRGRSLAAGMSDYLVQGIDAAPGVEVRLGSEVAGAVGDDRLRGLVLRDRGSGSVEEVAAGGLFVMIGAEPHTDWLPGDVARDDRSFVLTGGRPDACGPDGGAAPGRLFETSLPGVFAVGDVRAGSVKRPASSVGEGAVAVRQVHEYLADLDRR